MYKNSKKTFLTVYILAVLCISSVTLLFLSTPVLDPEGNLIPQSEFESKLQALSQLLLILASLASLIVLADAKTPEQPKNTFKPTQYKHHEEL